MAVRMARGAWIPAMLSLVPLLAGGGRALGGLELRVEQTTIIDAPGGPELAIETEIDKIIVSHRDAVYDACYIADASLAVTESRVDIRERNAGAVCGLGQTFDFRYRVFGLRPGRYDVNVYREDGELLGRSNVRILPFVTRSVCREGAPPEEIVVETGPQTIVVRHLGYRGDCALDVTADVTFDGDRIRVGAMLEQPNPGGCLCPTDIAYEVRGLSPGSYRVEYVDLEGRTWTSGLRRVPGPRTIQTQSAWSADPGPDPPPETRCLYVRDGRAVAERWNALEPCTLDSIADATLEGDSIAFHPSNRGFPTPCEAIFNIRYELLDVAPGRYRMVLEDWDSEPIEEETVRLVAGPSFLRGSVSESGGSPSITDAISVLGHLFLGAPSDLGCPDAADSNDDGAIDLADPVFLLNHLFLGGSEPSEPFPDLGADPTPDGLGCESPPCLREKLRYEESPEPFDFLWFCAPRTPEVEEALDRIYPEARFGVDGVLDATCPDEAATVLILEHHVDPLKVCELTLLEFISEIRGGLWE